MDKKTLHMLAFLLTVVGALNWGLVGVLNLNVVNMLLGSFPLFEKLVYLLVGAGAVYLVVEHKQICKYCMGK